MENPSTFADAWIRAWNANDLEALLSHYAEDVTFTSPRAAALTGQAVVRGKPALRAYWAAAIARTSSRQFTLDRVVWDAGAGELAIIYMNAVDGRRLRATEFFRFGTDGLVTSGEAMYGAEV